VDDLFIFSDNVYEKQRLITVLQGNFDLKFLGPVKHCLGMKVNRDRKKGILTLSQREYAKNLLAKFEMANCKPVSTPMELNFKLEKAVVCETKYPYQQLIGGLMYLATCTRPDML
jgi:hypothetical protein